MSASLRFLVYTLLFLGLGTDFTQAAKKAGLEVFPQNIVFDDLFDRRQLLVSQPADLGPIDRTTQATYRSSNPKIATVDNRGFVAPRAVGSATIQVEYQGQTSEVPVKVESLNRSRPVHFHREVVPVLTRFGCNSGGCHGKASGQNGFKLSLFGFDANFDYQAIVLQGRGRRVFPAAPDQSLLLLKAIGKVPHGGGRRFSEDSDSYRLIRRWIAQGMPPESEEAATLSGIRIVPEERMMRNQQDQQLAVLAEYSDGSVVDVTRQAQFESNAGPVASVSEAGLVHTNDLAGEAAIMARYQGQVSVFQVLVPQGDPLESIPEFQPKNYIDELALAKWKKLGLRPSRRTTDAEFLRRVTIDLCGRLPTVAEAREFLADTSPDKRRQVIDKLLDSEDYAAFFAMRWGTILRNSRLAGADKAAYAFHNWLKDLIAQNRPYDELVRGVVAAAGEWQDAPAINWYWQMRDDQLHAVVGDTAQVFLGLRIQCAQCHHHPYERWSQSDYYGLAGFFTRLGRKSFGQPPPYYSARTVKLNVQHPITGQTPKPKLLDGEELDIPPEEDPRHVLVDWMTEPENPFFAKALVNRFWGHMLGRGLVDAVDDLRETNPPTNPELLDALAQEFIDHRFDMKHILRTIANSEVYQLSSIPSEENRRDQQNHARFYARRLVAEVLHDAIDQVTEKPSRFNGMPASARAVDLPHEGFGSYFLDTFGRPKRVTGCECERTSGSNLSQVLLLANSNDIENKIAASDGRIARLVNEKKPPEEVVEELYLAAFSRLPNETERKRTLEYIQKKKDPRRAYEDILWSLLNSKEFVLNH